MKVWLACFLVLFALAELFQWAKQLSLPLPIYILGGAFLAIASNYSKLNNLPWQLPHDAEPMLDAHYSPTIADVKPQQLPKTISFTVKSPESKDN